MPFMHRTPCVNKCLKYSCYVLLEQFLCNLFCDGLYSHTVYTHYTVSNCCLFVM